jgi:putative addiction module killer protein
MITLRQTKVYAKWWAGLKSREVKARIDARIDRLRLGNAGEVKPIGEGVSELRIHFGPGYRVYFMQRGELIIVLLCGGEKSDQVTDIAQAKVLAREWES